MSQFELIRQRRFGPFFWTQCLGAFNDNLFKNALLVLLTFGTLSTNLDLSLMNNLGAFIFIVPYFFFSALAGQIADKYEKAHLIRLTKLWEIFIMVAGAIAFFYTSTWSLMVLLFLMGTQSTFFGPIKYSLIPQHVDPDELIGANALVETGTFLAILLGTLAASLLLEFEHSLLVAGVSVIIVAVVGYAASRRIPAAPAGDPELIISWNIWRESLHTLAICRSQRGVYYPVLAISWFWFLGAAYLTQIYVFTKDNLQSDQQVVMLLLALFSIGVTVGALLCERLSHRLNKTLLCVLGSVGLTLSGLSLFPGYVAPTTATELMPLADFIQTAGSAWVVGAFLAIGICGGLYIVPLYAMVQQRATVATRSRVIAANNILNAIFIIGSALYGVVLLGLLQMSLPAFFLTLALLNGCVSGGLIWLNRQSLRVGSARTET